ncbi:lathosterol oxidase-like [Antedon mediterranea]|uniref:lathosterol oxidase-like n=1 Tax=Antedon mediterranea TaxID=105859 RepID=UPI003AF7BEE3
MDIILQYTDEYVFTPYVYPASWEENNPMRQCLSLFFITWSMGYISYLLVAVPSYFLIFDHDMMKHPHFKKNQLRQEIFQSSYAMPIMFIMSTPMYYLEISGKTRLRDNYDDTYLGYFNMVPELIGMIIVVDFLSYTIHRVMHHKFFYKYLHKEHHKWKVATPFATHAFHPVDGFLQQMPYHVCVVLFPVNKYLFVAFLVFANIWAVTIHDGEFEMPDWMKSVINGPAHHTDHHMYFNYNYGQFFTVWDRICGSYRHPSTFEGVGPLDFVQKLELQETKTPPPPPPPKYDVNKCELPTDCGVESADEDFNGSVCSFEDDVDDDIVAPTGICKNCTKIDNVLNTELDHLNHNNSKCIDIYKQFVSQENVFLPNSSNILSNDITSSLNNSNSIRNTDSTETLIRRCFSVDFENSSMNEFRNKRRRFSFRG